jgi:hypothetical protein
MKKIRQQATGNMQQAGKPRRAKGRRGKWTKGRGQQATCNMQASYEEKAAGISLCLVACTLFPFCLNQDSQDYRIYRMRKIEVENTKIGGVAAIYTLSSWHCCRDAKHRIFFRNKRKETTHTLSSWHCCRDAKHRVFFGDKGKETTHTLSSWHCCRDAKHLVFFGDKGKETTHTLSSWHCRDAKHRVFFGDKRKETTLVRHCGLDSQSPFIRRIRREASRLYNLGDSDLRQNDGYRYTEAMFRMGLNMYNPLQAKRSWGYKITTTLSELRSSSICYHINHLNHSSDKKGRMGESTKGQKVQATSISSWLACLLPVACCLLPYNGEWAKARKVQATSISSWLACLLLVACSLLPYNNVIKSNL